MKPTRRQFLASTSLAAFLLPKSTPAQQVIYTPEHLLKREFDQKEAQWRENVMRHKAGQALVDYTNIPLSEEYDLNDLIAVLGGEWDAMPQPRKDRTLRSWQATPQNNRRTICNICQNPFKYFIERLNANQQNQFNEFNAAYLYSINHEQSPSSRIFATKDGSTTNYFSRHYPWIWLDQPTVPGRMIIFRQGYIDNTQTIKLDFPSIKRYADKAFSEREKTSKREF